MTTGSVFISYSKEDLETARRAEQALSLLGLLPRCDKESAHYTPNWSREVRQAIESNDAMLLLWSQHSAQSHFVQYEWTTAMALGKTIVPCILDATPLEASLSQFQRISLQDLEGKDPKILERITPLPQGAAMPGEIHDQAGDETIVLGASAGLGQEKPLDFSEAAAGGESDLVGKLIGGRYRMIKLLGRGGMGAVYLAHDGELEREVALKIIRADLADDPAVLKRFKREIQLSSTVTHKNVLRVYDLGESQGIKFLTMQYVQGEDLAGIIRREGAIPVDRMVPIFRQICQGLEAAHEQGILHRDLKPSNVMLDPEGRVYLTDFGLAKSAEQSGITQTGNVLGTPHYMSPEQVKGEAADLRSDIYSLGVILYEMATGHVPYSGETMYEVMIQRVQKPPRSASELNPETPPFIEKIIQRCMAIEKVARYQNIKEVVEDLDRGFETGHAASGTKYYVRRWRGIAATIARRKLAFVLPLVLLLALSGTWFWLAYNRPASTPAAHKPVSVLIADFQNRTGVPQFDGAVEQSLETALEGASFITTYNRGRARQQAERLKPGVSRLDESMARLVAAREGINIIAQGAITFEKGKYQISLRAIDALTAQPLFTGSAKAANREDVVPALMKLSAKIRKTLGDTTPESAQLAEAETFTAGSLEAAKSYALAQEIQGKGAWEEALPHYRRAVDLDSRLGRAYAGMAVMYRNLGQKEKAVDYYKQAMANIDRMTDRERYRTRGGYFVTIGDSEKAIEEYSALVKQYPADSVGHSNLALSYYGLRKMTAALDEARRATEIFPKNVVMRTNLALFAMYAGDFATALREATSLRKENSYGSILVCKALSELGMGNSQEAIQTYKELEKQGSSDASIAAMGLADVALYEGRFKDAAGILRAAIDRDRAGNNTPAAARKATSLAWALLQFGEKSSAFAQAEQAAGENSDLPVLYSAARVFLEGGRDARALEIAASLGKSMGAESRAYGKLIEGEAKLKKGEPWEAIRIIQESQQLADTWLARLARGKAYLAAQAYTEAYSEFEQCQKRQGEASALFLDDVPTLAALPPLYYYLGLAQEGLGSPAAPESYRKFLKMKERSDRDPLVDDARRRAVAKQAQTG